MKKRYLLDLDAICQEGFGSEGYFRLISIWTPRNSEANHVLDQVEKFHKLSNPKDQSTNNLRRNIKTTVFSICWCSAFWRRCLLPMSFENVKRLKYEWATKSPNGKTVLNFPSTSVKLYKQKTLKAETSNAWRTKMSMTNTTRFSKWR